VHAAGRGGRLPRKRLTASDAGRRTTREALLDRETGWCGRRCRLELSSWVLA